MDEEKNDIKNLQEKAENSIKDAKTLKELDEAFDKYLGKKSEIAAVLSSLKNFQEAERAKLGKEMNELKKYLEEIFNNKLKELTEKTRREKEAQEWIDITVPGKKPAIGHLHPLTLAKREVSEIFQGMGFSIVEGPEVESEWYNFDALNFPPEHPAREMQDTFFIKQENREKLPNREKLLLRTHTSPVQIHYMEKNKPPFRIITPGRVFRHEATDAGHEVNFYQIEGLMVGKDISVASFKTIIREFLNRFFGKKVEIRLRSSFFPFVEPGFEIDMSCLACEGKGCSVCKQTGWIELMGAGMVHPNVFKSAGLDPKGWHSAERSREPRSAWHSAERSREPRSAWHSAERSREPRSAWQGFAFGIGMDRLTMMKYKINDIRLFYGGDLRFLQQF